MRNLRKMVLAGALIATSVSASDFSAKVGATNIKFDNISETGSSISMISSKANDGFAYELGYIKGSKLAVTKFAGIYNWKLTDKFYAGAHIGLHGINLVKKENYNQTSFSGYTIGLQGKYAINKNNSIDLSYGSGSAAASSGVKNYDLTLASIAYNYRF
jgi:hypothetical protein